MNKLLIINYVDALPTALLIAPKRTKRKYKVAPCNREVFTAHANNAKQFRDERYHVSISSQLASGLSYLFDKK